MDNVHYSYDLHWNLFSVFARMLLIRFSYYDWIIKCGLQLLPIGLLLIIILSQECKEARCVAQFFFLIVPIIYFLSSALIILYIEPHIHNHTTIKATFRHWAPCTFFSINSTFSSQSSIFLIRRSSSSHFCFQSLCLQIYTNLNSSFVWFISPLFFPFIFFMDASNLRLW